MSLRIFDQTVAVEKYLDGNITVEGNTVHYGLEEVHGHVVDRILEFMRDGLPHEPLVKFLDKLMLNPSRHCRGVVSVRTRICSTATLPQGCYQ